MKKILIAILLLSLLFTACTPKNSIGDKTDCCTFTGTSKGSMLWNVNGADTIPSPVWTYHEKKIFDIFYCGPDTLVSCKGVVYVGGDRLTAIDLKSGKKLWETQVKNAQPDEGENTFITHLTVYGNKVVAVGARLVEEKGLNDWNFERCNLLVFDKSTGKILWKSTDIGSKNEEFNFGGYPVVINNKIYAPALNGEYRASRPGFGSSVKANEKEERGVWVWDLNTGKLLKKIFFPFNGGIFSPSFTRIRSYGNNLYIALGLTDEEGKPQYNAGSLYLIAFDTTHNKILWQTQVTDEMGMEGMINSFGVNNKVVAIFQPAAPTKNHGATNDLKVFDRTTGKLLWRKEVTSGAEDFSLTENGLFIQLTNDDFTCLDPVSGKELWVYKCGNIKGMFEHPVFLPYTTQNILYIENSLFIIALDPDTGKEIWRFKPYLRMQNGYISFPGYYLAPVNNGFVTLFVHFYDDDAVTSPPMVQLWLSPEKKN